MCATVCPSQALFFGTREQIEQLRPLSAPINTFQFGEQTITTRVNVMVPRRLTAAAPHVDVTGGDGRAAAEPRGVAEGGERPGRCAGCSRGRERSVRRGGGLAMADARRRPASPARSGASTRPAAKGSPAPRRPSSTRRRGSATRSPSPRTSRPPTRSPPGGRTSRSTGRRISYVERRDFTKFLVLTSARVHARPVVDRGSRTGRAGRAGCRRCSASRRSTTWRSAPPSSSAIRTSTTPACWSGVDERARRLQPEVHAPVVRGRSRGRPRASSTAPATRDSSTCGRACPSPGRRGARCRGSCSRCAGDDIYAVRHRGADVSLLREASLHPRPAHDHRPRHARASC